MVPTAPNHVYINQNGCEIEYRNNDFWRVYVYDIKVNLKTLITTV